MRIHSPRHPTANGNISGNFIIDLSKMLRVIQFCNAGGYRACPDEGTEDGF